MFGNFGFSRGNDSGWLIEEVWQKGQPVANYDPAMFRMDSCGAWMQRTEYGNRQHKLGWEMDHITPASLGGSDSINNLRPLQWENNASRQNGPLTCPVKAFGNLNVGSW